MIPLYQKVKLVLTGLLIGSFGWVVLLFVFHIIPSLKIIDGTFYGILFRAKPKAVPSESLFIIDVKDKKGNKPRAEYAHLIKTLFDSGAKVVGLDLLFEAENNNSSDGTVFIEIVREYSDMLVFGFQDGNEYNTSLMKQYSIDAPDSIDVPNSWEEREFYSYQGITTPFKQLYELHASFGFGHVLYHPDADNTVTRFPMISKFGTDYYPAFALEVVKRYFNATYTFEDNWHQLFLKKNGKKIRAIPVDDEGDMLINFIPIRKLEQHQYSDSLALIPNFNDSIVLIANSEAPAEITGQTPLQGSYPKWAIHASLISQILNQDYIEETSIGELFLYSEIFVFFSVLWLSIVEYRIKKFKAWHFIFLIIFGYLAFAYLLLCFGTRIFIAAPILLVIGSYSWVRAKFYKYVSARKKVFVSYSHKDGTVWLDKLHQSCARIITEETGPFWDDTKIKAGKEWEKEINKALKVTKVAVLLVSKKFLTSDFINNKELKYILKAAKKYGLIMLWVPLDKCNYQNTKIAKYHAASDPSEPLNLLPPKKQQEKLDEICRKINEAIKS